MAQVQQLRPQENSTPLYIVEGQFPSRAIPFHRAENLIQSAAFAGSLGYPLVYHATIRWPDKDTEGHERFLRRLGEWLNYNVGVVAYIWAREAKSGPHSHILLYVPKNLAPRLRRKTRAWLKVEFGSLPTGSFSMTRIDSHGDAVEHIRHRVAYLLKGDKALRKFLGVDKADVGQVIGKAIGVSQSLGVTARKRAGSVLPSGHRKITSGMLEAAHIRDRWKADREAKMKGLYGHYDGHNHHVRSLTA